jgi:osmotically-inducible protein OsmY
MATATMTDRELQRDVLEALKWEPSVDAAHIGVSAEDGVVTLTGYVSSYGERYAAEQAAKRVHGVKAVVNDIEVKLPGSSQRTDEEIAQAAVDALRSNVAVPADRIKVTVSKGWITLEGEVEWQYQRLAAESAVRNLPGVVGVSNQVVVRPRVSPAEVQSKIEDALERSAETDARRITVEVDGGKVVLRGKVRSLAEKEEAELEAWGAPGVYRVENLITVEEDLQRPPWVGDPRPAGPARWGGGVWGGGVETAVQPLTGRAARVGQIVLPAGGSDILTAGPPFPFLRRSPAVGSQVAARLPLGAMCRAARRPGTSLAIIARGLPAGAAGARP